MPRLRFRHPPPLQRQPRLRLQFRPRPPSARFPPLRRQSPPLQPARLFPFPLSRVPWWPHPHLPSRRRRPPRLPLLWPWNPSDPTLKPPPRLRHRLPPPRSWRLPPRRQACRSPVPRPTLPPFPRRQGRPHPHPHPPPFPRLPRHPGLRPCQHLHLHPRPPRLRVRPRPLERRSHRRRLPLLPHPRFHPVLPGLANWWGASNFRSATGPVAGRQRLRHLPRRRRNRGGPSRLPDVGPRCRRGVVRPASRPLAAVLMVRAVVPDVRR